MNRRVRYGIGTAALIGALAAGYYLAPIGMAIISLGEICLYSPAGTNLCPRDKQHHLRHGDRAAADRSSRRGNTELQRAGHPLYRHNASRSAGLLHTHARPQHVG